MGIGIWQIIILLLIFALTFLPCIFALISDKTHGGKKFLWFIISLLFSWLGYLLYWALVVRKLPQEDFVPRQDNPNRQFPY